MGALTMTIDAGDPWRLRLRDDRRGRGGSLAAIADAAVAHLAAVPSQLVVDVEGIAAPGVRLVALLNDLARRAVRVHKTVVLELPDDADGWDGPALLHPSIRMLRTSLTRVAAAPSPAAGVAPIAEPTGKVASKRSGRRSIASYGDGRTCEAAGCSTTLSRYNGDPRCWLHMPEIERQRG